MLTRISDLADGAFERTLQEGIAEIAADSVNPDKVITAKRSVTFVITLEPTGRGPGRLSIKRTALKLARNETDVKVPVQVSLDGDISERNSAADGHRDLFNHSGDAAEGVAAGN